MRHAGLAGDRESPQLRARNQHGPRAPRDRLDDIRAAADSAVDQDRDSVLDGGDDRRQSLQCARRTVELPAAVIGDDQAVDARRDRAPRIVGMQNAL